MLSRTWFSPSHAAIESPIIEQWNYDQIACKTYDQPEGRPEMGALNHSMNHRTRAEIKLWEKQWQVAEMGLNSSTPAIANQRTLRIRLTIKHLH